MKYDEVNFEDELIEVIRAACPSGKEKEFKTVAKKYWAGHLVTDLIDAAIDD